MKPLDLTVIQEGKVREILAKDEVKAKEKGARSFWKAYMELLEGDIKDPDYRNTVFMHTVKSIQYASKGLLTESTTTSSVATYNKAMLPTIIRRVFPQIAAAKFVATRQLDVPTQVIQTFRLKRNTNKDGIDNTTVGKGEMFDPSLKSSYPNASPTYQLNKPWLDPFYSSQKVNQENLLASGQTVWQASNEVDVLQFGPVIPGTIVVYKQTLDDPLVNVVYATDDGAGAMKTPGNVTVGHVVTYGVLNGTACSITWDAGAGLADPTVATYKYVVNYEWYQERNKNLSEVSFVQSNIQLTAKSRKNYAQISAEAIQDLEAYSDGKLDALKELVAAMTESMALEIDAELIQAMISTALKSATWDQSYPSGEFRGTLSQRNQELVHRMNFLANDIASDYLRGDDFFVLCHPHVYTILQNTEFFRMQEMSHKSQGESSVGAEKVGVIDNFTIARAPQMPVSKQMLVGFASKDLAKAPYAYFPYVSYLTPPAMDVLGGDIFSTVVGLQQRYDHKVMLDGGYGLGTLTVSNLYKVN